MSALISIFSGIGRNAPRWYATDRAQAAAVRQPLAKRRLLERAQLARVQRLAPRLQQLDRCEADLQMLRDGGLVERVGGARQLDLAVQRLVGDAQQRAVGHAQPEALRGDRAALHVDGDGARQVDPPPLLGEAQLPVAIVVGDDGAGAQPRLQRVALWPVTCGGRVLQRHLHLGQRRDRHLRRHQRIENAILPQIGVRQHVVADRLAFAQAAAVADHQPAVGPQHRQMIGDVLGVRRADADVDQRHALAVRAAPGDRPASGSGATASWRCAPRPRPARCRARSRRCPAAPAARTAAALVQPREADAHELVDVAVIVGQQHPALHVPPVAAGVVHEAAQRVVDAGGIEQRQRQSAAVVEIDEAVGDLVADGGEIAASGNGAPARRA